MSAQPADSTALPALPVRDALFDLDGTLYSIGNGLEHYVRERIFAFMVERLGVEDVALARELWTTAFRRFNQSLRGLRACGYTFDTDEYWRFIRGDSARFLAPAPQVAALLRSLNAAGVRCWVFTNCREREALEALHALELDPALFRGVLGSEAMGDRCKPELAAFERVVALTGCDPAATVMFEDSLKNLITAKAMGMRTVLIGGATAAEEGGCHTLIGATVDAQVEVCSLDAVRAALPQLWPQ